MSSPLQARNTAAPVMDVFQRRHLESTCPVAVSYFSPGLRVLDVGCGPGSMTVDIARMVHPGSVVGVDLEPDPLDGSLVLVHHDVVANHERLVDDDGERGKEIAEAFTSSRITNPLALARANAKDPS